MHMKLTVIILGILIVIGAVMLFQTETPSDVDTATENEETMNLDEMSTEEMGDMEAMVEGDVLENDADASISGQASESTDDNAPETSGNVTFNIDSFSFGYSMEEIRVKEGDTVTINLTNSGGMHDWVVDEFSAATDVIPAGGATSVTFVAGKAGTYEYYCSVGNHRERGMVGTLIVE